MLPASAVVLWMGSALGFVTLAGFAWAWATGHFADVRTPAWVILDPEDLRYERPWETSAQRRNRSYVYGPLLAPPPGEWGGAK